jgi:hypothetical protein
MFFITTKIGKEGDKKVVASTFYISQTFLTHHFERQRYIVVAPQRTESPGIPKKFSVLCGATTICTKQYKPRLKKRG